MASRDVVVLNLDLPRLETPQSGDTVNIPRPLSVNGDVSASSVTLAGVQRTQWGTLIDSGTATSGGASTLTDSSKDWGIVALIGAAVKITGGTGAGQVRSISSHTGTVLTVSEAWTTTPDATSTYEIYGVGNQTLDGVLNAGDLSAIAQTIVANAKDWCIYDTAKDSDGGRKITQGNIASSVGNQRAKILIALTATSLTLYDLTDPTVSSLRSWTIAGGTSVAVKNGKIIYGGTGGLYIIDLLKDEVLRYDATNLSRANQNAANYDQGTATWVAVSTSPIVNATVEDVAIDALDDAPIDSANGLPVPTIAVATGGGVSVIKDDGNVWDVGTTGGAGFSWIDLVGNTMLTNRDTNDFRVYYDVAKITSDLGAGHDANYSNASIPASNALAKGPIVGIHPAYYAWYSGNNAGITLLRESQETQANGMVAYISSTYNTGWMVGDIRGCFAANSITADRSVKNVPLVTNVAGVTLARTDGTAPVAGELSIMLGDGVGCQKIAAASASHLNFTTELFHVAFWVYVVSAGGANYTRLVQSGDNSTTGYSVVVRHNGEFFMTTFQAGPTSQQTQFATLPRDQWVKVDIVRTSTASFAAYYNGVLTTNISSATHIDPAASTTDFLVGEPTKPLYNGDRLGLLRLSATTPTAEQIKHMYETERKLFEANAKALLSADSVTRLDYYEDADILGVKTASAYDYLHGLQVVNRGVALTDTSDLGFGRVQINGTSDVRVAMPAERLRDKLAANAAMLNKRTVFKNISSDGSGVLTFPQGLKPVHVVAAAGTPVSLSTNAPVFDGFLWKITGLSATTSYDCELVEA